MIELLTKIFIETEHLQIKNEARIIHFSQKDLTHYFVLNLPYSELLKLKSLPSFRDRNEDYRRLKKEFDRVINKESTSAEKNSSLIILVEVDSLGLLEKCKQQIFLLEEDENYFKKFVILYSQSALHGLLGDISIETLQEKVSNQTFFEEFFNKGYSTDLEEYLFLLQLFIKLPFLKLKSGDESFKALDIRIEEMLGETNSNIYKQFLEMKDKLIEFDFDHGSEEELDQLLKMVSDDQA